MTHKKRTSHTRLGEDRLRLILREEIASLIAIRLEDGEPRRDRDPELMTAGEAAKFLRVDERTLRRLVQEGRIPPPVRIGRRAIRYDPLALRRALGLEGAAP